MTEKPRTTPLNTGEGPVARQLEAYNRRNINSFSREFAEDVRVYLYPDELLYEGRDALHKQYDRYFADHPELHCELISRVRIGAQVIDEERVVRAPDQEAMHAIAIYEVTGGIITEVRFLKG